MSLIAMWIAGAHASGTIVALTDAPIDDPDAGMVVPPEVIVPDSRWTAIDEHAMRNLGEELLAVRPLMHKFDGELEIMARLEEAISHVHVLRNEEERRLMYIALAFQGFAVQRYFQDELATDPIAEPYRVALDGRIEVKAWVDAVALDPFWEPTRLDISEEPELRAFQSTRDRLLYTERPRVFVDGLAEGSRVVLDGQRAHADFNAGAEVLAGRHVLFVAQGEQIVARADFRVQPGDTWRVVVPPPKAELDSLQASLAGAPEATPIPYRLATALERLPGPVHVAVAGDTGPVLYRIDGTRAVRVEQPGDRGDDRPPVHADIRATLGGAWMYDRTWYLLNADEGATESYPTLNSAAPVLGASTAWSIRLSGRAWVAGGGADVFVPSGEWHHLPMGDRDVRTRVHPYAFAGVPQAQFTVGAVLPWHTAIGGRLSLPLVGDTRIVGGLVVGTTRFRKKLDGLVTAEPEPPIAAYVGLSIPLFR